MNKLGGSDYYHMTLVKKFILLSLDGTAEHLLLTVLKMVVIDFASFHVLLYSRAFKKRKLKIVARSEQHF